MSSFYKQRKPVLLLELIISFMIIGVVLGMVFRGFHHAVIGKSKLRFEKEAVLGRERLRLRLAALFRTVKAVKSPPQGGFLLSCEQKVDHDPLFRGMLEVDLKVYQGKLMLTSWRAESEKKQLRTEVLYEGVQTVVLMFFNADEGAFMPTYPLQGSCMMKVVLHLSSGQPLEIPIFL